MFTTFSISVQLFFIFLALSSIPPQLLQCFVLSIVISGRILHFLLGCLFVFGESVFFCNSGAEALEGTIKLCRKFHHHNKNENKINILVCKNAFHGRTLGTLAAGDNEVHRVGFGVNTNGFIRVPFGNILEIER